MLHHSIAANFPVEKKRNLIHLALGLFSHVSIASSVCFHIFPLTSVNFSDHTDFLSTTIFPSDELNCGTEHLSCLLESDYKHRITLVKSHDGVFFLFSPASCVACVSVARYIGTLRKARRREKSVFKACSTLRRRRRKLLVAGGLKCFCSRRRLCHIM